MKKEINLEIWYKVVAAALLLMICIFALDYTQDDQEAKKPVVVDVLQDDQVIETYIINEVLIETNYSLSFTARYHEQPVTVEGKVWRNPNDTRYIVIK